MTNNNLYDLPKIATVSYYDVETDQNLTAEEWNQLHPKSDEITLINKSGSNFKSEKDGYGPMTLYRDLKPVLIDYRGSGRNEILFQYQDGTIANKLEFEGIDEIKKGLEQLENGRIKLVKPSRNDSLKYDRAWDCEKEVKEYLRSTIKSLENNYKECPREDNWGFCKQAFPFERLLI